MQLEQQIVTFWKEKCWRALPWPWEGSSVVERAGRPAAGAAAGPVAGTRVCRCTQFCGRGPAGYRVGDASLVFRPEVTFESQS